MKTLLVWILMTGFALAQDVPVLDALDLEKIRANVGIEVIVEGLVVEVGKTKEDSITFINIGAPKRQGFVAVIFRANYTQFPDGFDKYRGKKVRVKGIVETYKNDLPQIPLKSVEQITIVE